MGSPDYFFVTVRDNAGIEDESECSFGVLLWTISDIYAYIKKRYEDAVKEIKESKAIRDAMKGITIYVTYNKEFHYPEYIYIDALYHGIRIGGGTAQICVSEFSPLSPAE